VSNKDKNIQFSNVCKELGIIDKGIERRFHEYLNSPEYEDISDNFTYQQLLKVGKEFLEFAGITKLKKVKRK
jgi:hypothetical protein